MKERKGFFTDDGYILWWHAEHGVWTDGDHVFLADKDGHPLDETGKWLEGIPMPPIRKGEIVKKLDIRVGGYYVSAKDKTLVRHIYDTTVRDGRELFCWESNLRILGARDHMMCSAQHLQRWASREATPEEIEEFHNS